MTPSALALIFAYTCCEPKATNWSRPPATCVIGAITTAEIINTPTSAVAKIVAILVVIIYSLAKGSTKCYLMPVVLSILAF
jgi:hypothetical protein